MLFNGNLAFLHFLSIFHVIQWEFCISSIFHVIQWDLRLRSFGRGGDMGVRGGTSGTLADVPVCWTYTPVGLKPMKKKKTKNEEE